MTAGPRQLLRERRGLALGAGGKGVDTLCTSGHVVWSGVNRVAV